MALIGNPIVVGYNNAGQGQGYGTCSTATSATGARIATLANYNLQTGGIVSIYFDNDVPANAQLNINSKGQKDIYYRGGAITANVIKSRDIATFMYDGTRYQLISLDRWGSSPNFTGTPTAPTAASATNTTQIATTEFVHNLVDPKSGGYAVCSTASSTTAKVAAIDNYELVTGGLVTIKFTYAVPAGATLNINSKGAKAIYFKDSVMAAPAAIDASTIRAGDICTFVYDGTRYVLTNIDRWGVPASTSRSGIMSAADKTALNTAVSNIGDMQEMNTDATTLAGGIGELKGSLNTLQGDVNDLDALFGDLSFKMFSMTGEKTATLTFASKSNHAFIFTSGAYVAARSIIVVATSGTGVAADPTVLAGGEGVTMAKNANTVSITNRTNAMMVCGYMLLAGDIPTITIN